MKKILLTQGRFALVDDSDYSELSLYKWTYMENGRGGYAYRKSKKGTRPSILMHRQIIGAQKNTWVDHIDFDGLNNQRSNLRPVTPQQNAFHSKPQLVREGRSSKYKGVHWCNTRGWWITRIQISTKLVYLGHFDSERKAATAWDEAAAEYHRDYAWLNFA